MVQLTLGVTVSKLLNFMNLNFLIYKIRIPPPSWDGRVGIQQQAVALTSTLHYSRDNTQGNQQAMLWPLVPLGQQPLK